MSYQQQSQFPRSSTLTQTPDEMYTSQPIQYTNIRSETQTYTNPNQPINPSGQPVQYENYQSETKKTYPSLPSQPDQYEKYQTETKTYGNQQSSGQPVQYENYRTETKSYTNPPQNYNQGQPQGYNYRSYSKSYTTPPQSYGYPM